MVVIEIIGIIVMVFLLIVAWIGMWCDRPSKMSDYELYGKDSDEYLKDQCGEYYYNKHYKKKGKNGDRNL